MFDDVSIAPSVLHFAHEIQFSVIWTEHHFLHDCLFLNMVCDKLQTGFFVDFIQHWISTYYSSLDASFTKCATNSFPDQFLSLSWSSLQCLVSMRLFTSYLIIALTLLSMSCLLCHILFPYFWMHLVALDFTPDHTFVIFGKNIWKSCKHFFLLPCHSFLLLLM